MTTRTERKPFTPLNQYPGLAHSHSQPAFSPTPSYSQGPTSFNPMPERLSNRTMESPQSNYIENKLYMPLSEALKQPGNVLPNPPLCLTVTGSIEYELDEKDVVNLFARFGKILKVLVKKPRTALILFEDPVNALGAQKSLNKCYLKNMNITLYVNFCQDFEEEQPTYEERLSQSAPKVMYSQLQQSQFSTSPAKENVYVSPMNMSNKKPSLYTFDPNIPFMPNTNTKLTCKYEIQIENEKEFRVAQKIIGSRGCNMKKIIEISRNYMKTHNLPYKADFLKLRLRGKGSGFKEGPDQRESEEPIHLCVSSRYTEVFDLACKMVEELLIYVYREYETFCRATGRRGNFPMQIRKNEICSTPNERQTPEKMIYNMHETKEYPTMYSSNPNPAFYGGHNNENYRYNSNMPIMSPSNQNFDPEMYYRQFGQERSMNVSQEGKYRQGTTRLGEGMSYSSKFH